MAFTGFNPKIQLDGSPYAGSNCNTTEAANVAMSDQRGIRPAHGSPWPPTGASVREAIRPVDHVGGTNLGQVDRALSLTYGALEIDLDVRYRLPVAEFVRLVGPVGKPAILQGAEGATRGTIWQGSETFVKNHSWGVFGHRGQAFPFGETLVHDPLWDGRRPGIAGNAFRWIPDRLVADFMKGLDLGEGRLLGPGLVYAAFGDAWLPPLPDTSTAPAVAYRYHGKPHNRGLYVVDVSRARLRRSPYNRDDNVLRTIPRGYRFRCRQTTELGSEVHWHEDGRGPIRRSQRWFGDATGRVWIHESCVDVAK